MGALYWPDGAIRSIGRVDLLMEPDSVRAALEVLSKAGWNLEGGMPDTAGNQFYFAYGVSLRSPGGGEVWVHWRALPHTDLSLLRPGPFPLQVMPSGALAIPPEYALVAALGGGLPDEIGWQYDAIMICRAGLDWELVTALLRWRSTARNRLDELRRDWDAEIPPEVTQPAWTSGVERILASALRAYRRRTSVRS